MTVAELSVRKPITIVMVYILICVISCVFIPKLGIALYPKTTMPVLSVFANYPGVGPEEVDKNVTQLIVDRVKSVQGIKNITSNSSTGSARVMMEFGYNQDLDEAKDDIEQALSGITNALPDGCSNPTVRQFDMSSAPIMRLAIRGNLDLHELNNLAESTISPMLQRVQGVAQVDVNGGAKRQVVVDVIYNRLEAYGISLSAISEEMGLVFCLCLILICISCYVMFLNIAMQLQNRFYKLVALGLGTCYIFQTFLTIGGVTKFIPSYLGVIITSSFFENILFRSVYS